MFGRLINYLLVPLYTGMLTEVADYGVVGVMFSYASLFAVVFAFGLETGFFNFARKQHQPEKVFATATHFLLITGFIWISLSRWFAPEIMQFIGYPDHPEYAVWFTIILSADAISSLAFAYIRQQEKPWNFAWVKITNILINVGANLFFLVLCPYWSDTYQWAWNISNGLSQVSYIFLSNLIASTITLLLLSPQLIHLRLGLDIDLLKKMLRYSYPIIFIGLAGMINETFDRILLKSLLPSSVADYEVSIYSAFYKLSMVLTLFVQAFRFAVEPYFFEQSKSLNPQESYAFVMKWFVYAVSLLYLITIVILPYIAPLLIRNEAYFLHPEGLSNVPYLLAANLLLGVYYNLSVWYKVSEKTLLGMIPAIAGAIITIVLNLILIPKIGIKGSAITTLITYASMVIIGFAMSKKHYPIPYNLRLLIPLIALCLTFGYILAYWGGWIAMWGRLGLVLLFFAVILSYEKKLQHAKNIRHQ
jgi:O-antigen/teichoic acid export membrane protein